jgi:DNA-binding winged helix-turn-helix (wHTH) protein
MTTVSIPGQRVPIARMTTAAARAFRLGRWRVEPGLGRLSADAVERVVEPKVMDVLVHLASRPGDVVSSDELIVAVWRGRPMGDNPVHRCVSLLRRALGDDAHRPRYIGTIPKRGYRLVAPVEACEGPPACSAQERAIRVRIDLRARTSMPQDAKAAGGVTAEGTAGSVFEGILWIAGTELRVTGDVAAGADLRAGAAAPRAPELEQIARIVRSIAQHATRAAG